MDTNRTINTATNALGAFVLVYLLARLRKRERPARSGLLAALAVGAVSYVALGFVDFEALEARAQEEIETVDVEAESESETETEAAEADTAPA